MVPELLRYANALVLPQEQSLIYGISLNNNPTVRSSYFYNPRIKSPLGPQTIRRYQKTSQFDGHHLFAIDVIVGANPSTFPHYF